MLRNLWWHIKYEVCYRSGGWRERLVKWAAWSLPREIAMWTYIRVAAHATSGEHGNTHPGELSVMDALKRWDE